MHARPGDVERRAPLGIEGRRFNHGGLEDTLHAPPGGQLAQPHGPEGEGSKELAKWLEPVASNLHVNKTDFQHTSALHASRVIPPSVFN